MKFYHNEQAGSRSSTPAATWSPIVVAVSPDDNGPITPKVEAAEEGRNTFDDDVGRASASGGQSLKRPLGPRGKESPGSGSNIPLAPVGSANTSPSPTPEPTPAS